MATPTVAEPKRLMAGTEVTAADTVMYTSPNGQDGTRLTAMTLCNSSGAAETLTVWLSPGGGAGVDADLICKAITIPGDGWPVIIDCRGIILNADDEWRAQASAASAITMQLFGIELD